VAQQECRHLTLEVQAAQEGASQVHATLESVLQDGGRLAASVEATAQVRRTCVPVCVDLHCVS